MRLRPHPALVLTAPPASGKPASLTRQELLEAKLAHCIQVAEGLARNVNAMHSELELMKLPAHVRNEKFWGDDYE